MPKESLRRTLQTHQGSSHQRMNAALGIAPQRLIAKSPIKQEKEIAPFRTMDGVIICTLDEITQHYAQLNEQIGKLNDADFNGTLGRRLIREVAEVHKLLPKNKPTTTVNATATASQETVGKAPTQFNLPVSPICVKNAVVPSNVLTSTNTAHTVAVPNSSPRLKV